MQVLILEDDPAFQAQLAQAMMAKGFNVLCVATVPAAEAFLRLDMADVLIFGERIDGRLTHPVALLAECRNPLVAAVLLTERTGPDLDELFDLMPALVGILGRRVAPPVVTQVVMAAVAGMATESARSRLASRWAAVEQDAADLPVSVPPAASLQPQSVTPSATLTAGPAAPLMQPADLAVDVVSPTTFAAPVTEIDMADVMAVVPVAAADDRPSLSATLADVLSGSDIPPVSLADLLAARPVASVASAAPALPAVVSGPAPRPAPVPMTRPSRPSPDSPLARVLAAGHRAFARNQPAATAAPMAPGDDAPVATTARPAALPTWLTQPPATMTQPALPAVVPASLPARPLPAHPAGRRLHLA